LVDREDRFVIVVEGLFDVAITYQYGYSVVGTLHAGLTDSQAAALLELGMPVLLMYDNDAAGVSAIETAKEQLLGRIPLMLSGKYPRRRFRAPGGKLEWVKDPAKCTMKEVDIMVEEAIIL
jgi:DNA primase